MAEVITKALTEIMSARLPIRLNRKGKNKRTVISAVALVVNGEVSAETLEQIKIHFYQGLYSVKIFNAQELQGKLTIPTGVQNSAGLQILLPDEASGYSYVDSVAITEDGSEVRFLSIDADKIKAFAADSPEKRVKPKT